MWFLVNFQLKIFYATFFVLILRLNCTNQIKTTVAAISILSVVSFGAFAADIINSEQAQGREAIGTVSVGAVASSPMDMHEMLNKKAQEEGASSYRIIEARTGDHWHATAELYK